MRAQPTACNTLRVLSAALIASTLGCSSVAPGKACTREARAGITVDVRDSVTNALIGRGARIIARRGAVADTARDTGFGDGPFALAYERAGVYFLTVEQSGYRTWTRDGVEVTAGECHVNRVSLLSRLQR